MVHFRCWAQSYEKIYFVFKPHLIVSGQSVEHLSVSLTMPNKSDMILSSDIPNLVNLSWDIEFTHFLPREIVKLCMLYRIGVIQRHMVPRVSVPSRITEPDIVPFIS